MTLYYRQLCVIKSNVQNNPIYWFDCAYILSFITLLIVRRHQGTTNLYNGAPESTPVSTLQSFIPVFCSSKLLSNCTLLPIQRNNGTSNPLFSYVTGKYSWLILRPRESCQSRDENWIISFKAMTRVECSYRRGCVHTFACCYLTRIAHAAPLQFPLWPHQGFRYVLHASWSPVLDIGKTSPWRKWQLCL